MRAWLTLAIALALASPVDAQMMGRGRKLLGSSNSSNADVFRLVVGASSLSGAFGEAVTFTRASSKYCTQADYTVTVLANDTPCIVGGKVLIENTSTNQLLRSAELDNASWTATSSTITANSAAAPWGGAIMDTVGATTVATGNANQTVTVTSSAGPYSLSAWGRATAGTHVASIQFSCVSVNVTACTCTRDDGTACTATTATTTCTGTSSFSTTPQRVQVTATCASAITSVKASLGGGDMTGVATGQSHIWGGAQLEIRKYATSYIPTVAATAARTEDIVMVPTSSAWPIGTGSMSATITPMWGGTGSPQGDAAIMGNPYNSFPVQGWTNVIVNNGGMVSDHRISGVTSQVPTGNLSWVHGAAYFLRYTWASSGDVSFARDGTSIAPTGSRAAANVATSIKNPVQLGGNFNAYVDGWVSALCVSSSVDGCRTQTASLGTPLKYLWLSDSIYNMDELPDAVAALSRGYKITNTRATYGGQVVGSGLLELADATYAYQSGAWSSALPRGAPYSDYSALIFEFARNDGGQIVAVTPETKTTFRQAYDKLVAQGLKYFPKVVSGVCVPKATADVSAWDAAADEYLTLNIGAEIATVKTKYNASHVDGVTLFQNLVTSGLWTVSQLMRDAYHPTTSYGARRLGAAIYSALNDGATPILATPELTGDVVNYLYGQPTSGTWAFEPSTATNVTPAQSNIPRISNLSDMAIVASASGAKLSFPSTEAKQLWVHYFRRTDGGNFTIYVDRGTGSEVSLAVNTSHIYHYYPQSYLVSGTLSGGTHTVEIQTTSANPVAILGITVVKA